MKKSFCDEIGASVLSDNTNLLFKLKRPSCWLEKSECYEHWSGSVDNMP